MQGEQVTDSDSLGSLMWQTKIPESAVGRSVALATGPVEKRELQLDSKLADERRSQTDCVVGGPCLNDKY